MEKITRMKMIMLFARHPVVTARVSARVCKLKAEILVDDVVIAVLTEVAKTLGKIMVAMNPDLKPIVDRQLERMKR